MHGLGRLYIVMRAEEMQNAAEVDLREVANGWQAPIGKAILESWGLPESLQHAVERQDDLDGEPAVDEEGVEDAVSLTNVLVAAKILNDDPTRAGDLPALSWLNIMKDLDASAVLIDHEDEIQALRTSLGD